MSLQSQSKTFRSKPIGPQVSPEAPKMSPKSTSGSNMHKQNIKMQHKKRQSSNQSTINQSSFFFLRRASYTQQKHPLVQSAGHQLSVHRCPKRSRSLALSMLALRANSSFWGALVQVFLVSGCTESWLGKATLHFLLRPFFGSCLACSSFSWGALSSSDAWNYFSKFFGTCFLSTT